MKQFVLSLFLLTSLIACEDSPISTQSGVGSDIDLTGRWAGTLNSSFVGVVNFNVAIAQQDKISIENQQEGRQIISGVIDFSARDCYTSAAINSETSRIDLNNVRLDFMITGGSTITFQGVISGGVIRGSFTAEVTCDFVSPIVTTDTSETSEETTVIEDAAGNVESVETTTSSTGGSETTGGEVVEELVADGGSMSLRRI